MKLQFWLRKLLTSPRIPTKTVQARRPLTKPMNLEELEVRLTPSYTFSTLASFDAANISGPNSLVADAKGDLFGTTESGGANGNGAVFEIQKGSTNITTLASFGAFTGTDSTGIYQTNDSGADPCTQSLVIVGRTPRATVFNASGSAAPVIGTCGGQIHTRNVVESCWHSRGREHQITLFSYVTAANSR
jgi:uncharacterized repeat protein (TIGR03803 family)